MPGMNEKLKKLRLERGWTQEQAASAFNMSTSGYVKIENGQRSVRERHLEKAASIYGVAVGDLIKLQNGAPIVGYVGGGDSVINFSDNVIDETPGPPNANGAVRAVIVRGDSMYPAYRDRDLIFFEADERSPAEMIGRECVVTLADGRAFVKILRRGSGRGLFTLDSFNAPPIEDVVVVSATPVRWVERR